VREWGARSCFCVVLGVRCGGLVLLGVGGCVVLCRFSVSGWVVRYGLG